VYFYSATVVYFCSGEWCVFTPALTSSIRNLPGRKIPLFVVYAELDPAPIQAQNMLLIEGLFKRDKMLPTIKQVLGHNHISITMHFNTKDLSLGPDILAFIATHSGRRGR